MAFPVGDILSGCIDGSPLVRVLWRWLLERDMEVRIEGWDLGNHCTPVYEVNVGESPTIFAMFKLIFVNHRTDRGQRILRAQVVLKKYHLWLWSKTMCGTPLTVEDRSGGLTIRPSPFENFVLERQSPEYEFYIWTSGPLTYPVMRLPKRMFLELELDMVGPMRKVRRRLEAVTHLR